MNVFGSLKLDSLCIRPIHGHENSKLNKHIKYDLIDVDTLKNYAHKIVRVIDMKIENFTYGTFSLVFYT